MDFELNSLQGQVNKVQKDITAKKKAKESADAELAAKKELDAKVAALRPKVQEAEAAMRTKAGTIGNIVGPKVPISQTEVSA